MHACIHSRAVSRSILVVVVFVFARARRAFAPHERSRTSPWMSASVSRLARRPSCFRCWTTPRGSPPARASAIASLETEQRAGVSRSVARSRGVDTGWASRPSRARREDAPSFIPPGTLRPRVAFSFMSPRMRLARAPAKRTTASVSRCARERTAPFPFCPESIDGSNARDGARTRARRVKSANVCVDAPCRVESSRRSRAVVVGTRRRVRGRDACLFASLVSSPEVWCRKMSGLIG